MARRDSLRELISETKAGLTKDARPAALVAREDELAQVNKELDSYFERVRPEASARVKESLVEDSKRSLAISKNRLAVLGDLEIAIYKDIDDLAERLRKMNIGAVDLESLRRDIAQTEKMAERVRQEMETIRPELKTASRVTVWEEPTVVAGIERKLCLKYTLIAPARVLRLCLWMVSLPVDQTPRALDARGIAQRVG